MSGSGAGDGRVPGPRSAGVPGPLPEPRVPELSALLADLQELRLVLSADLGLAASALEVGALDIAAEMVAGGQDDLRHYAGRAAQHLQPEGGASADEPVLAPRALSVVADEPGADEAQVPRRSRRSRLMPLAPALAAAAALVGVLAGISPGAPAATPDRTQTTAAAATYAELWRLHEQGASARALRAAALELHEQVERLVRVAPQDPAAAEEALRLLELEAAVLDDSEHRDELLDALAETQRLAAALRAAVEGLTADVVPAPDVAPLPRPTPPRPVLRLVPPLQPATPRTAPAQPAPQPQPSTEPEREPKPSAEPSAEPSATSSPSTLVPGSGAQLGFRGV